MKLLRSVQQVSLLQGGAVATIGNFDGVHLGHQALLRALRVKAICLQLPMVVVMFEPQPREYFSSALALKMKSQEIEPQMVQENQSVDSIKPPARLSSLREKVALLRACGVDYVFCLKFNQNLASMPAEVFANQCIFSSLHVHYLLVGEDFRFGCDRVGDVALLQTIGHQQTCEVESFPDFYLDDERVRSTTIRQALREGGLQRAAKWLGRDYSMIGRVMRGDGRGRTWGIPTANVTLNRDNTPLNGVYYVHVKWQEKLWPAVANLGFRPTVDGYRQVLEVHLFDFNESLYGEWLEVYFLHKLRDEIKFSSVHALIEQIHQDVIEAKRFAVLSKLQE